MVLGELGKHVHIENSCEIGYPEKFASILETWEIKKTHRFGRFKTSELISDDKEIIMQIAGFGGANAFFYHAFSTPKNKDHWNKTIEKSSYTLIGNDTWNTVLNWISSIIESLSNDSDVSVQIFNPTNIIGSLYKLSNTGKTSYLPHFEVVAVSKEKQKTAILFGFITWNNTLIDQSIEDVIKPYYSDPSMYLFAIHQNIVYESDQLIMESMGLEYSQYLITFPDHTTPKAEAVIITDKGVSLTAIDRFYQRSLDDFCSENPGIISGINKMIQENSTGF